MQSFPFPYVASKTRRHKRLLEVLYLQSLRWTCFSIHCNSNFTQFWTWLIVLWKKKKHEPLATHMQEPHASLMANASFSQLSHLESPSQLPLPRWPSLINFSVYLNNARSHKYDVTHSWYLLSLPSYSNIEPIECFSEACQKLLEVQLQRILP